jgi:hypothetical protein
MIGIEEMSNPFKSLSNNPTGLVRNWLAVTPSDSADNVGTGNVAIGLYITAAGDVSFIDADGGTATVTVPANFILTCSVARVKATGTTATGIFALISA